MRNVYRSSGDLILTAEPGDYGPVDTRESRSGAVFEVGNSGDIVFRTRGVERGRIGTDFVAKTGVAFTNGVGSAGKIYPAGTSIFVASQSGYVTFGPNQALRITDNKARWLADGLYEQTTNRAFFRNLGLREVANPSQVLAGSFGPSTGTAVTTATANVAACPVTTIDGGQAADSGTLSVADTSAFPSSGTVEVLDSTQLTNTISYTGKTATTLTGCSGGISGRTLSTGATVTGLVSIPVVSTTGFGTPTSVTDSTGVVHWYRGYAQIGPYPSPQFVRYSSKDATNLYGVNGLTTPVVAGMTVRVAAANPDLDGMGGGLGLTGLNTSDNVFHIWSLAADNPWLDDYTQGLSGRRRLDYPEKQNRADTSLQAKSASINLAMTEAPYAYGFRNPMNGIFAAGSQISLGTNPKGMATLKERLFVNDRGTIQVNNGWLATYLGETDQPTCAITTTGGSIPFSNTGDPATDVPLNNVVYKVQAYWSGTGTKYLGSPTGPATVNGTAGVSAGSTQIPVVRNATSQISVTWKRVVGASGYRLWAGHFVLNVGLVWDGYYDVTDPGGDIFATPTVSQTDTGVRSGGGWTASTSGPSDDNFNFGDNNRPFSTLYHDRVRLGQTNASTSWAVELVRTGVQKAAVQDAKGNPAVLTTVLGSYAAKEQTTVGAAGAASALPATPAKYLQMVDSTGTTLVIPVYAAA